MGERKGEGRGDDAGWLGPRGREERREEGWAGDWLRAEGERGKKKGLTF